MKRPPRSPRCLVRLLALACASLLTSPGCEAPSGPGTAPSASEPIQLSLAERLAAADAQPSAEHLEFLGDEGRSLFRAGWHRVSILEAADGRWTRNRVGSLDVPVVVPAPLSLSLRITPARQLLRNPEEGEPQRLRILWNGEPLEDRDLGWQEDQLVLRIPVERQRIGNNQLDLLPSYWLRPRAHRLSWDDRVLGIRLNALEIRSDPPQVDPPRPVARRQGQAIVQRAGSVVSFGLKLPESPRLVGSLELRGPGAPNGRVLVSLTDEAGRARALLDRTVGDVARAGGSAVDADLSGLAGRFVTLDLAFSLAASESATPPPEIVWMGLRIEGTRPAAPAVTTGIARGPYNVIVLLPDSLRHDHLDLSSDETTPNARRLAARGVRFENMRSNSSWTRPAVASMFTSLGPISHGIHGLGDKLHRSLAYLPQLLTQRGYHTFAILNSPVVSLPFQFGRGYERVYTYYELRKERRAAPDFGPTSEVDYVWREFVETELAKAGERPFFLFLHEIDPHSPYEPPEPWAKPHETGLRAGFNLSPFASHDPRYFDAGEMEYLRGLYRGEVAYMDAWLGRLLDVLDASGLAERTLVVLISDHGEEFYEHNGVGHGKTVYEEQLRIPFIMSLPGVLPEGQRSLVGAQIVDVAPTLLDLLGAEIPPAMQGRSLLPWIEGAPPTALERPIVAHAMNRKQESIQMGSWKLVRSNPMHPDLGSSSHALYDLEKDPGELTDLWQSQPVAGIALRQQLELEIRRQAAATGRKAELEPAPIPPEMIEALKALGYGDD